MFICGNCHSVTKPRVTSQMATAEARDKRYPARHKVNRNGSDDPGGYGREIVREVRVCPECAQGKKD